MTRAPNQKATRSAGLAGGFSLVEVMIALLIGTLLLAGLVQVFGGSRAAYQAAEGIARNQENGRFALDFLQRELRMAGHFGCVNDQARLLNSADQFTLAYAGAGTEAAYSAEAWPLRFNISLQGYEANGTAPGDAITLPATPAVAGVGGGNGWSPVLPADLAARAIPGSDVLVLRYLLAQSLPVEAITAGAAPNVQFDATRWDVLAAGVDTPNLFAVTDCAFTTVFAGTRSAAPGNQIIADVPAGDIGFRELYQPDRATLHRAESVAFYVGIGASGEPALMRCRATDTSGLCQEEELVEGIESLQLVFGVSRVANDRPTGYIQTVRTAAVLGDASTNAVARAQWRLVGATQVGLLVRSPTRVQALDRTLPYSVLGLDVTAPAGDQRQRAVYESTVALRNRLFGN